MGENEFICFFVCFTDLFSSTVTKVRTLNHSPVRYLGPVRPKKRKSFIFLKVNTTNGPGGNRTHDWIAILGSQARGNT